jgi:4'-phosphopantetheinyl transferase
MDEYQRAASLLDARERWRYVTAHGAARFIAAAHLGLQPQDIRWEHSPNGKPSLVGAQISLSHSGDLSMVAVTPERPVGVDIQEVISGLDVSGLAMRFFLPSEAEEIRGAEDKETTFARLWARKEAVIKASGGRLMQGLRIPVQGQRSRLTDYPGALPHVVTDVPAPQGFQAAVALAGTQPYRVETLTWSLAENTAVDR